MSAIATSKSSITSTHERAAKRRAISEARASIMKEGTISSEAMVEWLDSWGTPNELPPPEPCK